MNDIRKVPHPDGWFIAVSVMLICAYCAGIAMSVAPFPKALLPVVVVKTDKLPDRLTVQVIRKDSK